MDAAEKPGGGKSLWNVLYGVQLGVIGGVLMLAWFALISPVMGNPWWLIPNLFASHFYNAQQVYLGPGIVTIVGMALQIATSGLVGCLNGLLTPGGRLWGLGSALLWYLFCLLFLWKRIAPLMLAQAIQPVLWTGYFLFGSTLGWQQYLVRRRIREPRASLAG